MTSPHLHDSGTSPRLYGEAYAANADQPLRMFKRTAGNLAITGTTFGDLVTIGSTWDATFAAEVGDCLEAHISSIAGPENAWMYFDIATIVGGAPVNHFAGGADGIAGWRARNGVDEAITGTALYQVVAGDLVGGLVTVRLRARLSAAGTRTLSASAANPLMFWVKNIGPVLA